MSGCPLLFEIHLFAVFIPTHYKYMNKSVFSGKGTLTHSAHTEALQSLSTHPLVINGLWTGDG